MQLLPVYHSQLGFVKLHGRISEQELAHQILTLRLLTLSQNKCLRGYSQWYPEILELQADCAGKNVGICFILAAGSVGSRPLDLCPWNRKGKVFYPCSTCYWQRALQKAARVFHFEEFQLFPCSSFGNYTAVLFLVL